MKCVKCGSVTKVIDSRDDSTGREDWLIRAGDRVFGWWTSDFRLRNRACKSCQRCETTIEIVLSDLEDSLDDIREQLTITERELIENRIPYLDQNTLETLAINLTSSSSKDKIGLTLTPKTARSLVEELMFRRRRQREAQKNGA